jgi:hypothetical protein
MGCRMRTDKRSRLARRCWSRGEHLRLPISLRQLRQEVPTPGSAGPSLEALASVFFGTYWIGPSFPGLADRVERLTTSSQSLPPPHILSNAYTHQMLPAQASAVCSALQPGLTLAPPVARLLHRSRRSHAEPPHAPHRAAGISETGLHMGWAIFGLLAFTSP